MDTAEAAKKISAEADPSQAAIASEEAGRIYGLKVLKRNLANQRENFTRFVVVAPRPSQVDSRVPCKTSLVLSTGHHEGALLKALAILDEHKINLTKLESRPMQGSPFTYIFYLDFEGNASDPKIQEALVRLSGATNYLRILGTYPRERHNDLGGRAARPGSGTLSASADTAGPHAPRGPRRHLRRTPHRHPADRGRRRTLLGRIRVGFASAGGRPETGPPVGGPSPQRDRRARPGRK